MFASPRALLKSSLLAFAVIAGLAASGREARAQVTYVGTFALTNAASDEVLTDPYNSLLNSTDMIQYNWLAIPAQEWAFYRLPSGFFAIVNVDSGLFLEDPASLGGVVAIDQYQWYGGLNQQWFLYPLGNNYYAFVNVASGKVLTDPYASHSNGTYIYQEGWYDGLEQWWYLYFLRY